MGAGHKHENVVVCGPSGTGKSRLVEALGHAAVEASARVMWNSLESLGGLSRRHRADDTTSRAVRKTLRTDLICIADISLSPVATETAEALYRVVTPPANPVRSPGCRICIPPDGVAVCTLLGASKCLIRSRSRTPLTQLARTNGLLARRSGRAESGSRRHPEANVRAC